MSRALVLSGGGSKGAFTAGVVRYMLRDRRMDFDLAVGTSTGSLVGGPALLGDYGYLAQIYTAVSNRDIFRNSTFGRILNFLNLIDGPIAADMGPLRKMVVEYYLTRGNLQKLIAGGKEFVVTAVNVRTEKLQFISTREVAEGKIKPETFINAVIASCSEPVFVKPVRIFENEPGSPYQNDLFYDGGIKEFLPLEHAVVLGATELWAVSTSPLTNQETEWGGSTHPDSVNMLKVLAWLVSGFLSEVARGDRFRADIYVRWAKTRREIMDRAKLAGIDLSDSEKLIFSEGEGPTTGLALPAMYLIHPEAFFKTSLEFDPAIMQAYLEEGILTAERFFARGAPEYANDPTLRPWIRAEWPEGVYT